MKLFGVLAIEFYSSLEMMVLGSKRWRGENERVFSEGFFLWYLSWVFFSPLLVPLHGIYRVGEEGISEGR